jgi:hypothetical protein
MDIAKVGARVSNIENQPIFTATISGNQQTTAVAWNSVLRNSNNDDARIAISTLGNKTGIRLAKGTYIMTTAISAQQSYSAWTLWSWREVLGSGAAGDWVAGSEVALPNNGSNVQSDAAALIMRVDSPTLFSLELLDQATKTGTPTLLAQSTQIVVVGLAVPM